MTLKKGIDLLYIEITPLLRDELTKLGCEIEDASDFIHEERSQIIFPVDKIEEYINILVKHGVSAYSFTIRSGTIGSVKFR